MRAHFTEESTYRSASDCNISTVLLTNLSFQRPNEKRRKQRSIHRAKAGGYYKSAMGTKLLGVYDFSTRTTEITQP